MKQQPDGSWKIVIGQAFGAEANLKANGLKRVGEFWTGRGCFAKNEYS